MNLIELYKSKTIAEKQELIDSIRLKLTNTRETTIRSWLSGKRNPKPFAKKAIAKILKMNELELF